jgi:uncharacterized membrane protein (DUF485 family)
LSWLLFSFQEVSMADPGSQRSLTRVWILVLAVIVLAWVIYALAGGPSTPATRTGTDSAVSR